MMLGLWPIFICKGYGNAMRIIFKIMFNVKV
jgi:hypothetical protein